MWSNLCNNEAISNETLITMKITLVYNKNTITVELDNKITSKSTVKELHSLIKAETTSLLTNKKLPNDIDYLFKVKKQRRFYVKSKNIWTDPLSEKTLDRQTLSMIVV
jgi:hypothetical protein